jgi:glycosyltransferase involved in cell wall biosynthesis
MVKQTGAEDAGRKRQRMTDVNDQRAPRRPRLLFVGAFPPPDTRVVGGNIADCRALLASSFSSRFDLILLDSTQVSLPPPPLLKRVSLAAARVLRFLRLFETKHPDAMLVFASSGLSFLEKALFVVYGRLRSVPSLLSIRSGHFTDACRRSRLFRGVAGFLLKFPARLLCQGEQWRRFFTNELGIAPERCLVLENWVASKELLELGERRTIRAEGPLQILFLGWLEAFKGVFELLDAAQMLRADPLVPPFLLSLAGEGTATAALQSAIETKGLSESVRLVGLLEGPQKLAALERADIFVLPSHTEGLPNAMIEAMAAGLPVIVTPVGSVPDVVTHEDNGLIVPPRDASMVAAALRRLMESPALRSALGAKGHRSASTRFATEPAAATLSRLVEETIDEGRTR